MFEYKNKNLIDQFPQTIMSFHKVILATTLLSCNVNSFLNQYYNE